MFRRSERYFSPAAVGSNETTPLFPVNKGERVVWASHNPFVNAAAATASTMTLGDGSDVDGFISTTDLDLETSVVGTPIGGTGAYLANSGGKLYGADDTVDVVYTASGTPGAVVPRVLFVIIVAREQPG
jgi:hypothetical protein